MNSFKKKFIGNRAFYAVVIGIALPIMIQQGITSLVNMLDNVMVGRIGTEQMSGVSIVNQLFSVYFICIFGGVGGVGIFTAQYFGNKDNDGVRSTFRYKIWMGLFLTVIACLVLSLFAEPLISLYLNESEDAADLQAALQYGKDYLNILIFMLPAFMALQVYSSTLRETGETKIPMISGIVAVFVNLVLNYLLIFGKFGFPLMGVKGAALATVISRYIEAGIVVIYSHRHTEKLLYMKGLYKTLIVPFPLTKRYFIKGLPLLINETLWSIGMSTLLQCYSMRGMNVIVANNIAQTLMNIFNIVNMAMGNSIAIIVGQKLGAGDMQDAKETDNKLIFTGICLASAAGILMAMTAPFFPRIYNTTDTARQLATGILLIHAAFQPVHSFYNSSYFTLRAGGKTFITFLFDSCYMIVISVPIAYVLSRFTSIHMLWILFFVSAADLLKCTVGFILLKKNVWLNNIVATE